MDRNEIFAERFKSARNMNGFSLQELADKLNTKISKQALHKYEKGEVIPDSEMIALLSETLKIRPEYFFREIKVELGEVEFRKLKNLPAKDVTKIKEQAKDYLSRYIELEEIIGIQSAFKNPLNIDKVSNFKDVENAAQKVRKDWNLGSDPIFNVLELLEDNNIKVIEIEAGDAFDGMQTWVNGKNIPVIGINKNRVKKHDRIRFTAMHELAHLLLPINHLPEKEKETLCHQFAGAMLFPTEAILKEMGKSRQRLLIQELGALKQQYGISIQAIVMRLKDLGIITYAYYKQFFYYLNQMNWRVEEPIDYNGVEKSNRFDQLLYRALAEEQISMSKAASLKNQKVSEFKNQSLMF